MGKILWKPYNGMHYIHRDPSRVDCAPGEI